MYVVFIVLVFILIMVFYFVFFFSSRRRHTRLDCDWSSDVCSSDLHRAPQRTAALVHEAAQRGVQVLIAGAGGAAALPGVIAAETTLPVIGVPIDSSSLQGLDALLAMVQMPQGVPVATVAIGKTGAANAGILAAQILALQDPELAACLRQYKVELTAGVERADAALQAQLQEQRDGS